MAEKLALIDKDLLLRLLARTTNPEPPSNPVLKEMNHINEEIRTALDRDDVPDRIKTQKVNELLTKHDTFNRQFENQQPSLQNSSASVQNSSASFQTDGDTTDHWYTKTVAAAPLQNKRLTENLLDHIKTSKRLQWDRDGRIVVDGETIQDSNLLDLVHGVTRLRKKAPIPKGTNIFLKALSDINTPLTLLPNANYLKSLNFPSDSSYFTCTLCPETFGQKRNLARHMITHKAVNFPSDPYEHLPHSTAGADGGSPKSTRELRSRKRKTKASIIRKSAPQARKRQRTTDIAGDVTRDWVKLK